MSEFVEKLPSKEDFSHALDSLFKAELGNGSSFDLILVGFEDLVSNEVQENFSLLFSARLDADPKQGIYRLESDHLGKMELFLVPVKRDESGVYFEAVFNQFLAR